MKEAATGGRTIEVEGQSSLGGKDNRVCRLNHTCRYRRPSSEGAGSPTMLFPPLPPAELKYLRTTISDPSDGRDLQSNRHPIAWREEGVECVQLSVRASVHLQALGQGETQRRSHLVKNMTAASCSGRHEEGRSGFRDRASR